MKILNAVLSVILSIVAGIMLFNIKSDKDFLVMFITLLMAIIFFLFYLLEEQKNEIERLRKQVRNFIRLL